MTHSVHSSSFAESRNRREQAKRKESSCRIEEMWSMTQESKSIEGIVVLLLDQKKEIPVEREAVPSNSFSREQSLVAWLLIVAIRPLFGPTVPVQEKVDPLSLRFFLYDTAFYTFDLQVLLTFHRIPITGVNSQSSAVPLIFNFKINKQSQCLSLQVSRCC